MFFNSQTFLYVFLPATLAGYFAARAVGRTGNLFLFAASVFFYAWGEREYVGLLLGSLVANYLFALGVAADQVRGRTGRRWLTAAVLANLGLLGGLKYAAFAVGNLSIVWEAVGGRPFAVPAGHLPIGLSFFTFQAISYAADVYRRDVPAERSLLRFGLYVFLFPHLIAGPVVRYQHIAHQLADRATSVELFASGVRRFACGLAKKVLLADALAEVVNQVFRVPPHDLGASAAWAGTGCYALQIYFDFSGYSDMAIGLGRMFGFAFHENFRHPYAASSVTDFWRRWHVSLSSWFRDYVYVPLGGNRGNRWMTYWNLLAVFLLCGLWHGASWGFVIWGAWHGAFLILERAGFGRVLDRLPAPLRHLYTLVAVVAGWAFFRAESLPQAAGVLAAMVGLSAGSHVAGDVLTNQARLAFAVGCVAALPVVPWVRANRPLLAAGLRPLAPVGVAGLMLASAAGLAGSTYSAFIYFRF